jgi:hypothetical protein
MPHEVRTPLRPRLLRPLASSQAWGCCECEWDRLRKWAIDQNIIDHDTGPTDMVSRIIELCENMHHLIKKLRTGSSDQ